MAFALETSAFQDGETIPTSHTCDGANAVPPLTWRGAPAGTRSLVLIMDDPDAPKGTFTHWLVYDIPPDATHVGAPSVGKTLPNDFGRDGYGGPCPPQGDGPHRYVFTLFALDVPALDVKGTTRKALERALQRHVLGRARLMGRYERRGTV